MELVKDSESLVPEEITLSIEHRYALSVNSANCRIVESRIKADQNELRALLAERGNLFINVVKEADIDLTIYEPVDEPDGSCKFVLRKQINVGKNE